jgi:hypothetical protein
MSGYKKIEPRYKKGQSGNPDGRPVGTKNRSTLLKKWIEVHAKVKNPITKELQEGTVEDLITIALIDKALGGDIQAIKEVNDTLYGKIQDNQRIELNIPILPSIIIKSKNGSD